MSSRIRGRPSSSGKIHESMIGDCRDRDYGLLVRDPAVNRDCFTCTGRKSMKYDYLIKVEP